jgi:hypothetical protein
MIDYVRQHPEAMIQLLEMALDDDCKYTWRASWLIWSCMEKDDKSVKKILPLIIERLNFVSASQQREYLKIIYLMEIEDEYCAVLYDKAVLIWSKITNPPAVRFNAFKIMLKLLNKYPELKEEFEYLIQDHYLEDLSPGVMHSIQKLINKIADKKVL